MTKPDFQTLMLRSLSFLADGPTRRTRDVITAKSDEFQLPADERVEMTPSGRARLMDNRVGWSLTHLSRRDFCSDLVAFKSVSPKQASTF